MPSKLHRSIRWHIQAWNVAILSVVVTGLVTAFYHYEKRLRIQLIDAQLAARVPQLLPVTVGRSGRPGPGPGSRDRPRRPRAGLGPAPGQQGKAAERRQRQRGPGPKSQDELFKELTDEGLYCAFWNPRQERSAQTSNLPEHAKTLPIVPASAKEGDFVFRWQGKNREVVTFPPRGAMLVVGKEAASLRSDLHRFAWQMAGIGAFVILIGTGGGWFFAGRAIRPIAQISDTARDIARGDLSHRIDVGETCHELSGLAATLNSTFSHLGGALEQQIQFTADASHELRTPLAVILAESQSALRRERTAEELREQFKTCMQSARHMRGLIDSLMELARIDSGESRLQVVSANLSDIARETRDLARPIADQKAVTLLTDLQSVSCDVDEEKIRQVFLNLVVNAIQHTPKGTAIRIRTEQTDEYSVFEVSDQGAGIAEQDLPHIFDRFYRADKARSGDNTGLGLAISNAIVVAHSGSISVGKAEPQGATFTVQLPCVSV